MSFFDTHAQLLLSFIFRGRFADSSFRAALKAPCIAETPDPPGEPRQSKHFWQGGISGGLLGAGVTSNLRRSYMMPWKWWNGLGGFGTGAVAGMIGTGVTEEVLRNVDPYNGICRRPDKKN